MKLKNTEQLAITEARKNALSIVEAGLEAIDTGVAIRKNVFLEGNRLRVADETFELKDGVRLVVVGIGKCAFRAATVLEELLGERITKGVALDIGEPPPFKKIFAHRGTHPFPSEDNIVGAKAITETLTGLSEDDVVLFVVSGGGSTLLCLPEDRGCDEEGAIVRALMNAGATIEEMNTVRKHLSLARGGYLAKCAYPARVVSLIFSDVPSNDIGFIASGPTVKDTTTIADAEAVLAKYNVLATCGIERCGLVETPKEDRYFEHGQNIIVVSNVLALGAMAVRAIELGFTSMIRTTSLTGEARDVGKNIVESLHGAPPRTAFFYGGETTVTMTDGHGEGGRNLELALAGLEHVQDGELLVSVASDGHDNTEFAGALCDILSIEHAAEHGLDVGVHLKEHRSYDFFKVAGDYLLTGPTGSNVSDLIVAIRN